MTDQEVQEKEEIIIEEERKKLAEQGEAGEGQDYRFRFDPAHTLIENYRPTQWLIKGYLEKGSMAMLFSPPESWKTFIALQMIYCISSGLSWFGNLIKHPGQVLYICGEGHDGLARRLRALELHYGIPIKNIPLFISNRPAAFLDKDGGQEVVRAIEELIKEYGTPSLIVIDTLSRNFGAGDESLTKDMSAFIQVIDKCLRFPYRAAVLIVHHTGLNRQAQDRARGSGALRGAIDFEFVIETNDNDTKTLTPLKVKDFEKPPQVSFRKEVVHLPGWLDEDTGEPETSLVMVQTATPKKVTVGKKPALSTSVAFTILKDLTKAERDARPEGALDFNLIKFNIDKFQEALIRGGISQGKEDSKRKAAERAIKELINLKLAKVEDDLIWENHQTGQADKSGQV